MIIQCPSCHTKFSVDATQVRDVDNPRFHCSRCDHYFEVQATESAVADQPGESILSFADSKTVPPAKQLDLLPSARTLRSGIFGSGIFASAFGSSNSSTTGELSGSAVNPDQESGQADSPIAVAWPDPNGTQAIEVDMSQVVENNRGNTDPEFEFLKRPRPIFASQNTPQEQEESQESFLAHESESFQETAVPPFVTSPHSVTQTIRTGVSTIPFASSHTSASSFSNNAAFTVGNTAPNLSSQSFATPSVEQVIEPEYLEFRRPSTGDQRPSAQERLKERSKRKRSRRISNSMDWGINVAEYLKPLALVLSFPVILAGVFWWWSASPSSLPRIVSNLSKWIPSGEVHLPPSGLELLDLKSEWVTLDSGKRIIQIAGTLSNATHESFKNILIEARSYDGQNSALETELVNYNNSLLSVERLGSLQMDTIRTLQDKPAIIGHALKPQAHFPFRAVLSGDVENAQWFSARVYGVTYPAEELTSTGK